MTTPLNDSYCPLWCGCPWFTCGNVPTTPIQQIQPPNTPTIAPSQATQHVTNLELATGLDAKVQAAIEAQKKQREVDYAANGAPTSRGNQTPKRHRKLDSTEVVSVLDMFRIKVDPPKKNDA